MTLHSCKDKNRKYKDLKGNEKYQILDNGYLREEGEKCDQTVERFTKVCCKKV